MKKFTLLSVFSFLLFSCSSPEKKAEDFYVKNYSETLNDDINLLASTSLYVYYANPENYWYPEEYTAKKIVKDEWKIGLQGLNNLYNATTSLPETDPEITKAKNELLQAITNTKDEIKKSQVALENANGLFGLVTFGGVEGLFALNSFFSTPEEQAEADRKGRQMPEMVLVPFTNLVEQIVSKYKSTSYKMALLENNSLKDLKPTADEQLKIREKYREFIKSKFYTAFKSNDTIARNEMAKQLLEFYDNQNPVGQNLSSLSSEQTLNESPLSSNPSTLNKKSSNVIGQASISGTNVIIRESFSTKSKVIGSFEKSGEVIEIIEVHTADNQNQGLINKPVQVEINNKKYDLVENKAVRIIKNENGVSTIKFTDNNQIERTTEINSKSISNMNSEVWYKVKRKTGDIGWVFGKFVIPKADNSTAKQFFDTSEKYAFCYQSIESKDENGESILLLQLTKEGYDRTITGKYGYYPHYETDSWEGKITGRFVDDETIIGTYVFSAEGMDYVEPFKMKFSKEKVVYSLSEGFYYVDGKKTKSEPEPVILTGISCE